MKDTRLKICAIVLSGLGITVLQAQETIPASGGNASGSGTCYFNYSNVNSADIGFSGVMIMKITEIAQ